MEADVIVIGAGVIGLAVARELARKGQSVILLEKEASFGRGVSSRNTEVIHAGIYYQTGSLKAGLCVRGRHLLYEYLAVHNINYRRIGKIIIATTPEEAKRLEVIRKQAEENGVNDLIELDKKQIKEIEPELQGDEALLSPFSGILDTHSFMKSLLKSGEAEGMIFAPSSSVIGAETERGYWRVRVGGCDPVSITCKAVINSAGLYATDLSKTVFPHRDVPQLHPRKGSYARYSGPSPLRHIVYPALIPGVIEERVDATPDLGGMLRFGPTSEAPRDIEDFSIVPGLISKIAPAIRRYLPCLDISMIAPDCAGIRPRIFGADAPVQDFRFEWAPIAGWLDLWGMESPGLTASLAIAEYVCQLIAEKGILEPVKKYNYA